MTPKEMTRAIQLLENAGLKFGECEEGFCDWEGGEKCRYLGIGEDGDWVVAFNTLTELESQLDELKFDATSEKNA